MAKNAVAGVSNSQCGMIIKPSASMRATRETLRWSNIVSNKTCTSFRRLTVKIHAMGRLNVHCVETSHPCRPRLMSAPFGGRLPTFQIRASHGENVLPPPALSGDNGVATLDSLLDGSSSENKTIPDKIDDRSDRWEAIIERVCAICDPAVLLRNRFNTCSVFCKVDYHYFYHCSCFTVGCFMLMLCLV